MSFPFSKRTSNTNIMTIIYRISDAGYKKSKPDYINNVSCLLNASKVFQHCNWHMIVDGVKDKKTIDTIAYVSSIIKEFSSEEVEVGSGAGTFNIALDYALKLHTQERVYFLENDYLHTPNALTILEEGLNLGPVYVAGYDHPDKYIDADRGGNPFVEGGGEVTKVFITQSTHWKLTNSTTMTFATKVITLQQDERILRDFTKGTYPEDFKMFLALRDKGRCLLTPLPGVSTHGENAWLSPFTDWSKI